jgi:ATPase subunit of ABC transporter with duplicated ATPase domains
LVWLEHWLTTVYTGITIVVSHDTCFLNTVATDIIELQSVLSGRAKSSLATYRGDYCTYENTMAELTKAKLRDKDTLEDKKEKLKEFIGREGKKYDGPAHQSKNGERSCYSVITAG